ncbi:hypothetical protein H8N00_24030 [Streptomyces sp. AC563]|uniref:hypothetical protein n=1 Tax=Streptomyces buecherae TaxID=2763006 RepID=UPI00164D74B0|nr:hypothetical protein [Streptomyces buecherae]MBC3991896.1 hypothetical protein [Streptomyces buecherae]
MTNWHTGGSSGTAHAGVAGAAQRGAAQHREVVGVPLRADGALLGFDGFLVSGVHVDMQKPRAGV